MSVYKKVLCMFLALVFVLSAAPYASASQSVDSALKFNADGKFKIMLFADSQDDEELEETTTEFMREALSAYKPDLVIYLGDNTVANGFENQKKAIEAVTLPVREAGIPFAIVFGNHDQEFGVTKEKLLDIYRSLGCLTYDAAPEIYGCGNCNLPILSSDGTKTAFNLWLMDSGSSGNFYDGKWGYDYIRDDQLEWYKNTAALLAEANGGKVVPAMNFQHIVIPEIYDAIHVKVPFSSDKLTYSYNGNHYFRFPVFTRLNGYWLEECCPPSDYDGQLDAWIETGDVIAAFHGHDHNNSYNVNIEGVDVVNVPTCGCNSYSKHVSRGCGLITLDENNPENYEYELITLYSMALKKDSKLSECDGGRSKAFYALVWLADSLVKLLFYIINVTGLNRL